MVESYLIKRHDPRWAACDEAAWFSKNIYNCANYIMRQAYFADRKEFRQTGEWGDTQKQLSYKVLYKAVRKQYRQDYYALPKRVANETVKQVVRDWQSYTASHIDYQQNPHKYQGRPQLPRYKNTTRGRNMLKYEKEAVSRNPNILGKGIIKLSKLALEIEIGQVLDRIREVENLDDDTVISLYDYLVEVRIVPQSNCYKVELVYKVEPKRSKDLPELNPDWIAGIDLGVNNLAAITSNKLGFRPILVNGRPLKDTNQFYNKRLAQLKSQLPSNKRSSHRIHRLTQKRNRRVDDYLHIVSKQIIDHLSKNGIGTLVIGKNDGWKTDVTMGRRNNQNFVQIPHARFIEMLTYKAHLVGIEVLTTEESYTSKCSFLDNEALEKHENYVGKRIKRGLFRASDGQIINADINGSANIIRKVVPNAFADGIEGIAVRPLRVTPHK
ncbi:MAG: transposase [Anaerolineae bacterium]|nr:transposase [Anaerolineae bacterium]